MGKGGFALRSAVAIAASAIATSALALVAGAASGGCSELPDVHFGDTASGEGGSGEGGAGEGGIDPRCKSTGREICDDGIDNDCNGRVDCQDSACAQQGFSCQDAPADWKPASFSASAHPSCGSSAASTDLMVAAGDGSASCDCTCDAVGGSCASGEFTVAISNESTCAVGAQTANVPATAAGCMALGTSINVPLNAHAKLSPPAPPTSCAPKPSVNGALTNGRLCQADKVGGGCRSGQVCAPKPANGLQACVAKDGRAACPFGFDQRSTAGTTANDGRSCNGCTCGSPSACSGGSVSLYGNSMCKTVGSFSGAENLGTACDATTEDNFNATFVRVTSPSGGCGAPTSKGAPGGMLSFTAERTVCCKGN